MTSIRLSLTRRLAAATGALSIALAAACGSDSTSPPVKTVDPVIGVTAVALSSSAIKVTFNSRTGDNSFTIERAEGAAGTFSQAGTATAPATPGVVTYNDNGLKANTQYRYRVTATAGGIASAPSSETSVTTLDLQNAAADITTDITASRTLYADTVYTLKGFIHVANGATLTIQPGTKIQGDYNTLASSLFIMRGAKIQAVGTAAQPIQFTSSRPIGNRQPGDWGGLLIVGNAPSSRSGNVIVEGTGTDGTQVVGGKNYEVTYSGGTTLTDNSGTLQYVRVEFAGFAPSLNNEFNGFTFAAIGSGTRLSYLQTMAPLDDSYEFFGGAPDVDHLVAFETADDILDMSEGFQGRIQYVIGYNSVQLTPRTGAGFYATDLEGIENDGCNGSGCDNGFNQQPYTIPLVSNVTLIGCGDVTCVGSGGGFGMMLRRGTGGYYINSVFARFPVGGVSLRDAETFQRAASAAVPDPATSDLIVRNDYFIETPVLFQANTATPASQFSFDAAANSLTLDAAGAATSLFVAIPAKGSVPSGIGGFDFTPVAGSPIATGGMNAFTGKIQTKAGTFVVPTPYMGAVAPGGTKWWQGWTVYSRA
jgi:hypothetical protein